MSRLRGSGLIRTLENEFGSKQPLKDGWCEPSGLQQWSYTGRGPPCVRLANQGLRDVSSYFGDLIGLAGTFVRELESPST